MSTKRVTSEAAVQRCSENMQQIYSKTSMSKCDFNKVWLQSNFIEITLWHGCFPVNLLHIFRTPFPKNTPGWLLPSLVLEQTLFKFVWPFSGQQAIKVLKDRGEIMCYILLNNKEVKKWNTFSISFISLYCFCKIRHEQIWLIKQGAWVKYLLIHVSLYLFFYLIICLFFHLHVNLFFL